MYKPSKSPKVSKPSKTAQSPAARPRPTQSKARTRAKSNAQSKAQTKAQSNAQANTQAQTTPNPRPQTQRPKRPHLPARTIFNQIVLIFAIGCIFGTYYEEILTLVKDFFADGTIDWFSRSGLVYGPFSPIYGVGAVGVYLIFYLRRASWPVCLLLGGFLGGAFEFLMSLLQEWIFETRSWDYSDRFLNICGRTTVPYMLFWGLLVVLVAKWLLPLLDRLYARLAGRGLDLFCAILAAFLLFDIAMSIAANIRQTERREGDVPTNSVETFLDNEFPDSRLEEIYENAEPITE